MRLARRGVGWDRAGRARLYTVVGRIASLGGVIGVVVEMAFGLALPPPLAAILALVMVFGIFLMLTGNLVATEEWRERMGDVEVDETGALHVRAFGESRTVARSELRGAWMVSGFDGRRVDHWVQVVTRDGSMLSVHVLSVEEGRALVGALGFGTAGRAVKIPLAKRTRRRFHLLLAFLAYAVACLPMHSFGPAAFMFIPTFYALMRRLFRPPEIEIGHDAVHVSVDFRTIRIPREDIARITYVKPASLVIERKNGSKVHVRAFALEPARVVAATELIDERVGNRPAPARAGVFERGGRGLTEWRAGLQTALEPDYRSSGTSIDDASAVLTSSTASVEQRIGAALALRVAGEPLEKVRVAAEGTVDPKIRVVLEAIAEGADDERLDETLRAMER